MGKDQELLDAARNGNITLIEKILSQRGKRSGLASLRRGPGANIQDSAGYSALHYAALNGHTDCVRVLLTHDALPNLPDSRGSSPLHLAAWAGHQEIVKLLLTQYNRPANPNFQTIDNETPLHCAAQHGHTGALTTLLAHGANPNMTNSRGEKPLDLAAQYGRLQVVQMLVRAHPELLLPYRKQLDDSDSDHDIDYSHEKISHSPLHLASRNGHKNVVEILLRAGMDVNLLTTSGTALHEAAICGKDSVVRTLLEFGADLNVTDSDGRTALDLLKQFPPHVTRGIVSVINNYQNAISLSGSEHEDILRVSRCYNDQSYHSRSGRNDHAWNSCSSNDALSMLESPSSSAGSLDQASPRFRSHGDSNDSGNFYISMTSSKSKVSPTPPKKPPRRNLAISPSTSQPLVSSLSARSNMSSSSSSQPPYEYLYLAQSGGRKAPINKADSVDRCQNYVKMMNPIVKQKHEAVLKQLSENLFKDNTNVDDDEIVPMAQYRSYNPNRRLRRICDDSDFDPNGSRYDHNDSGDDSIPISPSNYRQPPTPDHPPPTAKVAEKTILARIRPLSQEYRRSVAMYEYTRGSSNGTATFGGYENRHRLKNEKRQSAPPPLRQHNHIIIQTQSQPQSKLHQSQPQTSSASSFNQGNNCVASQQFHHRLRNLHSLNASSGSLSSVSDRSASTDCVEEYVTDVPFAGLFKGSTMTLDNPNLIIYGMKNSHMDYHYYQSILSEQQQQQQQQQQHKSQTKSSYQATNNSNNVRKESLPIQNQSQQKPVIAQYQRPERPATLDTQLVAVNKTTNSKSLPFDEQEEWKKITEIMANFGTDCDILKEFNSHLSHDLSENGQSNSIAGLTTTQIDRQRNAVKKMDSMKRSIKRKSGTQSPHSILINFLCKHEIDELVDTLMDNGYDDIDFVRGILDESDLDAMEIKPELRVKLMKAIDSDLQTPARAINNFMESHTNADGTIFNNSLSTNDDESHQNERNAIAGNCEINSNGNNNNGSTMAKQNNHNNFEVNGSLSVNDWLNGVRLPQYAEVFRKHLYTDMDRISQIWEIELQAVLEINKIGHRKRILYSVGAVPTKDQQIFEKLSKDTQVKATKVNASHRSSISISSHDSNNTNTSDAGTERENRPNHRKNRQAPKPPTQTEIKNDIKLLTESATNLEIRAPSELLFDFPTGLRTQWRHSAELLITGAVTYEVNYLGSTIVKELRGTESTKKSIQKLKKTDHLMGLNSKNSTLESNSAEKAVCILISYRGVQYVDPQTKGTICEHEIRNINCACQDADDLSHFAYITKDSEEHFCHVFNVASMDLATEIILTLGQAFEVAYQIALRKSKPATQSMSLINNLSEGQMQKI